MPLRPRFSLQRHKSPRIASSLVALILFLLAPAPRAAADEAAGQLPPVSQLPPPAPELTAQPLRPVLVFPDIAPLLVADATAAQSVPAVSAGEPSRSGGLVPLYVSYGALQALDVHSTLTAVRLGAVEKNGLVAPLVEHPAGLIAVKAVTTAAVIYSAERLSKRNRVAAWLLMIGANSAYVWVVVHNYRVISMLR